MEDAAGVIVAEHKFGELALLEGDWRVAQFGLTIEVEDLVLCYENDADRWRIARARITAAGDHEAIIADSAESLLARVFKNVPFVFTKPRRAELWPT